MINIERGLPISPTPGPPVNYCQNPKFLLCIPIAESYLPERCCCKLFTLRTAVTLLGIWDIIVGIIGILSLLLESGANIKVARITKLGGVIGASVSILYIYIYI